MPKVSVVMPVYNAERFLKEAMDSILGQTFSDFEFIIIDDASTDSSVDIIRSYNDSRIRFYQNEINKGVAATLNRGLDLANGEYIARMDSDDISLPERLYEQVQYMDIHKDIAVIGCGVRLFGAKSEIRLFSEESVQLNVDLLFNSCFAHPSVMMRASIFGKEGFHYDDNFSAMEDYELWVRTIERYRIATIPSILLKYRIHSNQVSQCITTKLMSQMRKLKERQVLALGILPEGELFESFFSYCLGDFIITVEYVDNLFSFFKRVVQKNSEIKKYSEKELRTTFSAIIKNLLNKLPVKEALLVASKCDVNVISYGFERIFRRVCVYIKEFVELKKRQRKLVRNNFTIISNNCWGGMIYAKYGLKYQSPTVGLYILGHDFVKLCSDWENYFNKDLEFISWESSTQFSVLEGIEPYPVAKLGDVEIYFMHYRSEEEAREKWKRRLERINPEHMLFKLSQREGCSKKDVEEFMRLPLKNKVCFSYDDVSGTVQVPELEGFVGDESPIIENYFDEVKVLNEL